MHQTQFIQVLFLFLIKYRLPDKKDNEYYLCDKSDLKINTKKNTGNW
jgi:hypothetical protein